MTKLDRRRFLARSGQAGLGAVAGTSLVGVPKPVRALGANEKIVLGVVGIRGRGHLLAMGFALRGDCEIAYMCDVDERNFGTAASKGYMRFTPPELGALPRIEGVEKAQGKRPKAVTDFRRALEDKSVDAIVTGTPDHWHAPVTVWSCQAGKHVYVEKPASHNPWEGRKMVEAARKYKRVVQLGTQSRSAPYMIKAKEYVASGKIGDVHLCRVYNQKIWGNVKPVADSDPPPELNWDMWNGPAPEARYNFNYWEHWNHFWRYSGGDSINDSIHQYDLARWLCDVRHPKSVYSVGGRWAEEGAFDTPDTQLAVYEFDKLVMTFEMTLYTPYMMLADQELRDSDIFPHWPQNASRIELFGTKALMVVGRHGMGWQVFGRPHQRQPVVIDQMYGRWSDEEHRTDFLDAIRNDRRPNADIEQGHLSTLLPQYANISYRLGGEKLLVDPKTETFTNSEAGNALLKREYREPWVIREEV
ncbi:MAG TPA: Gfo/Idh/MocA family oxidoreductase [Thermoguttaceae bacterium]|nr:Gfo/Idh/MocA family oxidoreductase [Thermoguttaceae bacterium]